MKEIRMQPFVREGTNDDDAKAESSKKETDGQTDSSIDVKNEHTEKNKMDDGMNNNNGNDDCWGSYQPSADENNPPIEHFNPITGLDNLGNTCYANSVFQVLRFTPGFTAGLKHVVEKMDYVETKLQVFIRW